MKVMLDEIARKKAEAEQERREVERRDAERRATEVRRAEVRRTEQESAGGLASGKPDDSA